MTVLMKFQKQGVRAIEKHNGKVLLADDMGLGKTIQSLCYLKRHPDIRPAVVVCPSPLKWVWEEQAKDHFNMQTEICTSTRPPKGGALFKDKNKIILINYEILIYWVSYLNKLNPKAILLDESHYIKSDGAIRTKAVRLLCSPQHEIRTKKIQLLDTNEIKEWAEVSFKDATGIKRKGYISEVKDNTVVIKEQRDHIIAISGTPVLNRPAEIWSTLNLLWPHIYPTFMPFGWQFCDPKMTLGGWEFKGSSNLKVLHRQLKSLGMIRRLKKDVLKELPATTTMVVPLEIKNRQEYTRADKDFNLWIGGAKRGRKEFKMKRLARYTHLKKLAVDGKMPVVCEWIDNFLASTDEKIVLGCWHKRVIQALHKKYKKQSELFYGDISGKKRKIAVKSFQQSERKRILIVQIKAGGLGLTLTAANNLAFIELPFDPGTVMQFIDRIRRIGQTRHTNIAYLIAKDTIEESICKLLQAKQKILNQILDGDENIEGMNLDIYNMLEKELRKQ